MIFDMVSFRPSITVQSEFNFEDKTLKGFGCQSMELGICAAGALANHMQSNLSSSLKLSSDLDSEEILDVTNTTVLGFFDEHLKSKETDWIQNLKNNVNTKIEEFNSIEK